MIRLERLAVATVLTSFFCLPVYLVSLSGGPPPGRSGGPFPGEQSCATAGCHGPDALNAGDGGVSFTINGGPPAEYRYTPGQPAMIEIRVQDSAQQRWGFEMTARKGDGCQGAGMFDSADQQIVTFMSRAGDCGSNMVPIAEHSFPKTGSGGATFQITLDSQRRRRGTSDVGGCGQRRQRQRHEYRRPHLFGVGRHRTRRGCEPFA